MSSDATEPVNLGFLDDPDRITVRLTRRQIELLDQLADDYIYPDRSKALRDATDCVVDTDDVLGVTYHGKTSRVTFRVDRDVSDALDHRVEIDDYRNRSIAIRAGVSRLLDDLDDEGVIDA